MDRVLLGVYVHLGIRIYISLLVFLCFIKLLMEIDVYLFSKNVRLHKRYLIHEVLSFSIAEFVPSSGPVLSSIFFVF
jgi:hypothetical protein